MASYESSVLRNMNDMDRCMQAISVIENNMRACVGEGNYWSRMNFGGDRDEKELQGLLSWKSRLEKVSKTLEKQHQAILQNKMFYEEQKCAALGLFTRSYEN